MHHCLRCAVAGALASIAAGALAQDLPGPTANPASTTPTAMAPAATQVPVAPPTAPACTACIPALSPVELVLDSDLGSKISKTGDTFAFHLAKAIVVDGREVVPVGARGQGEVIHAKKAGGSGTAGELVLAARYLVVGSQHLRLRSMHIVQHSADAVGKIDAFNAATVMSPVPVALIGFALTGSNAVFPKGTPAIAKIAEDFPVPATDGSGPAAVQTQSPASPPNR